MRLSKEIKIKLYLKNKYKPFSIVVDNENQVENLKRLLQTDEIITFGPITFSSNNFNYMIVED